MGPASLAPGLPISCQTYSAADTDIAFFEGYLVRIDGQLPPIQQGGTDKSRQQWGLQDQSYGV